MIVKLDVHTDSNRGCFLLMLMEGLVFAWALEDFLKWGTQGKLQVTYG